MLIYIQFKNPPDNSMELFLEENHRNVRSEHPRASRREIRRVLIQQWEATKESEKEVSRTNECFVNLIQRCDTHHSVLRIAYAQMCI